jgi:fluoride exporter
MTDEPALREALRRRPEPGVLAAIAVGGALGTLARYEVAQLIHVAKDTFPWATFVTNVSGAFLLGAFLTIAFKRYQRAHYARAFCAVGFLGSFTTFSTMAVETVVLAKDGDAVLGIGYLLLSVAVGLAASALGVLLVRPMHRRAGA